MVYKKIYLIVKNFVLCDTISIFRYIKDAVDENNISHPNFGHYDEDMSVRVRINFQNQQSEQDAMNAVNNLVRNRAIVRPSTNNWTSRNQESIVVRLACTLASECACIISDLDDFSNVSAQNPIPQNFYPCFLERLFHEIGIDLNFRPNEVQRVIERENYQDMITNSINAVTQNVDFTYDDFTNPTFFERFRHMLWNNLLVHQYGEDRFRNLFYRRNRRDNETEEETLQRFCNELIDE